MLQAQIGSRSSSTANQRAAQNNYNRALQNPGTICTLNFFLTVKLITRNPKDRNGKMNKSIPKEKNRQKVDRNMYLS